MSLRSRRAHIVLLLSVLAAPLTARPAAAQRPPTIAAASDLAFALPEIAEQFARETGQRVGIVFGSSGVLTRQVRDGAPFQMFLSADETFVDQLAGEGLTRDRGVLYAVGHIVLFAPTGSPLVPAEGLDGLARALARGEIRRFAIANPAFAPYGRAAEAALRSSGLWDALRPHLVLGDNVSQAAQFATSGNAEGGIIAGSLAASPSLKERGTYAAIPDTLHPPLRQRMVLLKRAGPVAERFYEFMQGAAARGILERHGFSVPR